MITVTGLLRDPMGKLISRAEIRVTATTSQDQTPENSSAVHFTGSDGTYSFPLVYGRYELFCNPTDEFILSGSIIVDEGTPSPIEILPLLDYFPDVNPPVILPDAPEWQVLHDNLRNDVDTQETDKLDSLAHLDTSTFEQKRIIENTRLDAQMSEETVTTQVGDTKVQHQSNVYEDSNLNQSVQVSVQSNTKNASLSSSTELYDASNGKASVSIKKDISSNTASFKEVSTVADEELSSVISSVIDSGIHHAEINNIQTAVIDINDIAQALQERGITVYNKVLYERQTNDGTTSKITKNPDIYDITDEGGTSVFKVDTEAKEVHLKAKLIVSNPEDFRGEAGNTIYEVYQYSPDNSNWFDDWVEGYNWRRSTTSTNGTIGTYGEGYLLIATDGADGDTYYNEFQYAATDVKDWRDEYVDEDKWRRWRTLSLGSAPTPWQEEVMKGANGIDGEIVEVEYQYSINGLEPWHTNFTSGDIYRRERIAYYKTVADKDAGNAYKYDAWTSAAQLVPQKGSDYFDGLSQVVLQLYRRSTTIPTVPTTTLTYNFLTFELSGDLEGWSTELPEGTDNLWLTAATASSTTSTDLIEPNEWVIPKLSAAQPYNQATVTLHKRQAGSAPSAPSTTLDYDFTTGLITGDVEGWSSAGIPTGTEDLYVSSATVRSQTTQGEILPSQWAVGILTSAAFRQQTVNIYTRGTPTPPNADVTYNFTTGSITGLDSNWSTVIPDGTADLFMGIAVASSMTETDTIPPNEWGIGALGSSGYQATVLNLYQSAEDVPAQPTADIQYSFVEGKILTDTSPWSTSVPTNTAGKIYAITATANASALADTDVVPVNEWTEPQVVVEASINAIPVTLYKKHPDTSVPPKVTNELTYSFVTASVLTTPNNGWLEYPPSVDYGEVVWSIVATAMAQAGVAEDTIPASEWTDPVVYTLTGSVIFEVYEYAETSTGEWFTEFTPERVWRRQAESVNGVVSNYSEPVKLTGEDGANGDSVYVEYAYSEDLIEWHPVLVEGDTYRKERVVTGSTEGDWSEPARLTGNEQYIEYQYAISPEVANWHSNFSTGDYFQRERAIRNGVADAWSEPVQIVPLKDVDYNDGVSGDTIYEIYEYSVDGLTEWEPDFTDASVYRRSAVVINGVLGSWSNPAKLSGVDGANGDTIYMEYEYSADEVEWHTDMADGDIWRHERQFTVGITEPDDPWGNATRVRGVDGSYYEYLYNDDDNNAPVAPNDAKDTWHSNFSVGDYFRIERVVYEESITDWSLPAKMNPQKGVDYDDGTAVIVQLVSDNGFFFKNNTGSVKVITAMVYINSILVQDVSAYNFHWKVGENTAQVTPTGDYVSFTPAGGLYPANGEAEGGLNFTAINIDFSDVADGASLNLTCEVTNI